MIGQLKQIMLQMKEILKKCGGGVYQAFIVAIALSSKVVVLDKYQSTSPIGKILELADAQLFGNTVMFGFVLVVLLYMFHKGLTLGKCKIEILGIIFAVFYMIGRSFAQYNDLKYIFGNIYQFGFALFYFVGYIIFFSYCIEFLINLIENCETNNINIFNIKKIVKLILFFLICWSPYIILFYPGSVPHDGYYQLNMFYGINQASNHHPWFSTMVMGSVHWIGQHISDNFGIYLYVLIQSIFCAFVFTLICRKIFSYKISAKVKSASILFYGLVPVWGAYAQAFIKDTIYYGLFALFMLYFVEIVENKEFPQRGRLLSLFLLSGAMELYRNEAIYILAPSFIILIFITKKKDYKKIVLSVIFILLIHTGFKQLIFPIFNVQEGSVREMLSVPFQQTARYVVKHEDELSEDEIETINQVLSYEAIKEKYDPNISDPVKSTYKNPNRETLIKYFKLWYQQLVKDPECYVEAILNHSFGYFYPEYISKNLGGMQFYIKGEPVATGDLDIYYTKDEEARSIISKYSYLWMKMPTLSLLMFPATYTWILFFLMLLMIRKKKWKDILICLPVLLTLGICAISPVNGYIRYMLPIMASIPLLVGFSLNTVYLESYGRKR